MTAIKQGGRHPPAELLSRDNFVLMQKTVGLRLVSRDVADNVCRVNSLIDLIAHPDAVIPDLRAETGENAIRELHARLCAATPAVTDPAKLLEALLERSRLTSVG